MLSRAFAVACDAGYYVGLLALLNSIRAYHGRTVPVLVYHRGLSDSQVSALQQCGCEVRPHELGELSFPSPGMWEAKHQILSHCIGLVRCVYLLDADLVLVSNVDDIFELAESGKIVSSADGPEVSYGPHYSVYSPRLTGARHPYINTGALCLDVMRHWDLAGLWAFASRYAAYSPGAGMPLCLPGHGDQGVFNAIAATLGKPEYFHVLPEGTWCDAGRGCTVQIRQTFADGRIEVWNLTDNAPQRLVHSSGPKWWSDAGSAHLREFGDKYACFQHFSKPAPSPMRMLIGICSSRTTALRRSAVRDTWMKRLPAGVQAVFFAGCGAGNGESDVVDMTAPDDYPGLPSKVHAFCRHALEHHEFDYLFKCDDDTYVVTARLLQLAAENMPFVGSSTLAPHGYASGGAGYLMSRDAVSAIAAALPPEEGAEDVWVSNLLREHGFPLAATPLLQPGHDQLPDFANHIITAHYCGPELMRAIDQLMTENAEHVRIVALLHAVHPSWQGHLKLLSDNLFLGGGSAPDGRWEWDSTHEAVTLRWFHWPPDRLELRDWGLEAPNLRLEFESGHGPDEFRQAMAQPLSLARIQLRR